jgi:endonuclease/exonuclease/phosphatase (EEP) superfamily protein YafD
LYSSNWIEKLKKVVVFFVSVFAAVVLVAILLLSVVGNLHSVPWQLAWYSNPRGHLLVFSAVIALFFLLRRNWPLFCVAVSCVALNLLVLAPFYFPRTVEIQPSTTISIALLNTNQGRADISALQDGDHDFIFLQEVTSDLSESLPMLLPAYEIVRTHPLSNTHGSTILVRKDSSAEIVSSELIHLPEGNSRPLLTTEVKVGRNLIQLLNLHIIRPHHAWADNYQRIELAAAAEWSHSIQEQTDHEVIIVGDLNTTPWSPRFRQLLWDGKLHDSLLGFGLQNSWPGTLPLILGIPIDHALHSKNIATIDRSTSAIAGTDHALLSVTLGME